MRRKIPRKLPKITRRTPLWLAILILGLTLGYQAGWFDSASQTVTELQAGTYRVVSVEDGDTITVDMNGRRERVRFIGVDTPETHDPRKPVQCFGTAASEFTSNLIGDNPVRLAADAASGNRDRYNRLLRYVYLPDGRLVNAEIIKQGYGFAYTSFPFDKLDEFRLLGQEAREAGRGLWAACEPELNEYGGYTSNPAE